MPFLRPPATRRSRTVLAALLAVLLLGSTGLTTPVASGAASTEATMETTLRTWVNRDRAALGLRPLRADSRLNVLAGDRASWMASRGVLTHSSADGSISNAIVARRISWYGAGETIAVTTASWGASAAAYLYSLFRHSPPHWSLLMSSSYNYFGIGVAYRPASKATYVSIALLEGPDRTRPNAGMRARTASGTSLRFSWAGWDPLLQTHTAGLRSFNVQLRTDSGPWVTIRTRTIVTAITLTGRSRGHSYAIRVQSTDRRGNVSIWSPGLRGSVP